MYPAHTFRQKSMLLAAIRQLIIVFTFVISFLFFMKINAQLSSYHPAFFHAFNTASIWIEDFYQWDAMKIMKTGIPVLNRSDFESDTGALTAWQIVLDEVGVVSRANLLNPAGILRSEITLLANYEIPVKKVTALPVLPSGATDVLSVDCLVAIYNTHTGETYSLTDGVDRLDGQKGGVVTVAAALQEELETKYEIKTARSERINDSVYNMSYLESEKTARELLSENPETMVIIDIHRDADKTREQSIVNINGQEVAPLLFIVGSDARRSFPNWRQNHAFAQELSDKINEMYPGLSLGVRVQDGVYNQSLHPHALLIEVGTTQNSIEEAVCSVRFLAAALAEIIGQQKAL